MVQESLKLQFGTYNGEVKDGKPNGHGKMVFNNDDIQERQVFEGTWVELGPWASIYVLVEPPSMVPDGAIELEIE